MNSHNSEDFINPLEKECIAEFSDENYDMYGSESPSRSQHINSRIIDKRNKQLLLMKTQAPIQIEKNLIILNQIIDKTQNCIFCQLPINKNDIYFSLFCQHRSCFICIYNKLQDITEEGPQILLCSCNSVIYLSLLAKNIIDLECLDLYVEMISKITKVNAPIKSYCPYDLHCSEGKKLKSNKVCKKCNRCYCQKCGLFHLTKSCLEYYSETYKEEIIKSIPKCTECNKNNFEIELICGCKLCNKCCKNMILKFIYIEDPTKDPLCEKHTTIIPRMFIYQAFGGQFFFIKEQEKAIDYVILSPKFVCEICLIEFKANQSITLDCNHRFCSTCIKIYLNINMSNYSFAGKMGCPKCEAKISYETLKSNSDSDIFERYLTFSVMAFQPEDNLEVMKWCVNCNFGCTILSSEEYFKCPNCESEYCPKCNKNHFMSNCEDLRSTFSARDLKAMLGNNEEYFNNFMQDYFKCPNCREAIQKIGGCNFLVCAWPRCKRICFCAICNKILTVRLI